MLTLPDMHPDWLEGPPLMNSGFAGYRLRELAGIILFAIATLLIVRGVYAAVYRLFLSPLSNIPGPKLAALTHWYEGYYEVWLGGRYFKRIDELHKEYGPIVRINPIEVHYNDPEFIDNVLPGPMRKTNRHPSLAKKTGTPSSMVTTVDHDIHRQRRNPVAAYFSTASIKKLEPTMGAAATKLLERLEQTAQVGPSPLQLHHLFKAYTSDVITKYAFGDCFDFMNRDDAGKPYFDATDLFFGLNHFMIFFPWFAVLVQNTPGWFVKALMPALAELVDKKSWWVDRVREIRKSPNPAKVKNTIFDGILNSTLPPADKTDARLASEAQLVIFAGEGTTAFSLTAAVYELLANPLVLARLKEELATAVPDAKSIPSFAQVDSLPYLNAVLQEVIRLHPGVMNRQMRVPVDQPVVYMDKLGSGREYVVPPGFLVSMSPLCMHMNPDVFHDPYKFEPQRWIDNPKLTRAFLGFSRGTRSCLGMNLARREMAVVLAALFRKYDLYRGQDGPTLELYDTERARDIDANHDMIIPAPAKGSKGLRVRIRH
ncbi:cytochrome P450 [Nemania abortiva]|nr:cytochrome P450 [Nemania abortiva]